MKLFQAHAYCLDRQSGVVVQQLNQYHLLEFHIEKIKQADLAGFFMFGCFQGIWENNNNEAQLSSCSSM